MPPTTCVHVDDMSHSTECLGEDIAMDIAITPMAFDRCFLSPPQSAERRCVALDEERQRLLKQLDDERYKLLSDGSCDVFLQSLSQVFVHPAVL